MDENTFTATSSRKTHAKTYMMAGRHSKGTKPNDFTTEFKYLGSIVHHSLTSDEDVDKRVRSALAAFGALKNILTNKQIDLKVKRSAYVALCLSTLLYGSEIWCLRKIFSIAFVISSFDALEPCATLPSLTILIIVDVFDGQATSPKCY
jgi:hypothetical protein